jgi:hypothetical protein
MKKIYFVLLSMTFSIGHAQISGCTDKLAKNYNSKATINNGSCRYCLTKIKPETSIVLSDSIIETSGLIAFDNLLWTHNDDHDTTIYGLDLVGKIRRKIKLENVINTDWEEISQDENHLYIGDFGNNYQGNRKDLHILKIEKSTLFTIKPKIEKISFSYSNQTDFNIQKRNKNDFDCEAFVVLQDSIYLFTKQWKSEKTGIYVLPKIPGNYVALLKTTLNVRGLVTGATVFSSEEKIVLCGYSKKHPPFLYVLSDFKNTDFKNANKRKVKLRLPFHQIEGIATFNDKQFYLTNESFAKKPFFDNKQKLNLINLKL